MDIRILPSNIANMIAAGEVVQRPASVVKELMENAVDAGASRINLVVADAGRTLVQVIDNGCGMTADQAVLCFERHATSKISCAEDLNAIETFGFRGEALASIAAVAEVVLKTRTADSEIATQVTITDATAEQPGRQDVCEVAAPVGSNFAVRNLFYNTPARRKFLKSDAAELKAIIAEFIKIALSRTDIAFSMVSNDREIYHLGPAQSLKYRIRDIFGESATDELYPIDAQSSVAKVSGFVARPDTARKSGSNQYFFVNGRFFRSPYLHKAVMKAYENLVPEGSSPSYFLYLDVDPHSVDINVHPTKTEIKFEDDNILFTVLMAAVKEALGRSSYSDTLDFDRGVLPEMHNVGQSIGEYKPIENLSVSDPGSFNPFDGDGFDNEKAWEPASAPSWERHFDAGRQQEPKDEQLWYSAKPGLKPQNFQALHDQAVEMGNRQRLIVKGKFILQAVPSGIMVINAVRAMDRIMYERFLDAMSREEPVGQTTMFPIEIEVGAMNMPVLEAMLPVMQRMGFDYAPFSPNTINVTAVPSGLVDDKMTLSALMYEAVTALTQEQGSMASSIYAPLAEKMAKSASRSAVLPTDETSARILADSLFGCTTPEFTSDGLKIVHILQMDELDKLFK